MGKKSKSKQQYHQQQHYQPNAPDLQQILLASTSSYAQQPPHNPYDFDIHQVPPPPYSNLTANNSLPMSHISYPTVPQAAAAGNYSRLNGDLPRQTTQQPTVIVHSPSGPYFDRKKERQNDRVARFNRQTSVLAIISIFLSIWAFNLYERRPCLNYLVDQPHKDVSIKVNDVRNMHITVCYFSAVLLFLSLIKCMLGNCKNYGCYLFIMSIVTFFATLFTGYLAYLAFYSPCVPKVGEVVSNMFKTSVGLIADKLPAPSEGLFGESNIFQFAKEDQAGLVIFCVDVFNFSMYASAFISSITIC